MGDSGITLELAPTFVLIHRAGAHSLPHSRPQLSLVLAEVGNLQETRRTNGRSPLWVKSKCSTSGDLDRKTLEKKWGIGETEKNMREEASRWGILLTEAQLRKTSFPS